MKARFDDVEVFDAIARSGSISAAARQLRRSPHAVTRALERLEGELGARLFHRTTRTVSLTDEGRRFRPHAESLQATLARAEADMGHAVETVKGTLRLTVSATFARFYLAPVVAELQRAHPELRLELLLTDDVVDLVERGLDAAIRIGPLQDSSLSAVRLSQDRRVIVAAPELLARVGVPDRPADLAQLPCLTLGGRDRWRFRGCAVGVRAVMNVNLGDFALEGAKAGLGFARLSSWLAGPSLRDGSVVRVLPSFEVASDAMVSIVTPSRTGRPARVEALLTAARKHLVPAPWERS